MIRTGQFYSLILVALISCAPLHAQTSVQPTGIGKPFSNLQDSIALNNYIPFFGAYPGNVDEYSVGMVRTTAGTYTPGDTRTDGRSLNTSANAGLYSLIGNAFGGNSSAFNIPNTSGRTIVGTGKAGDSQLTWAVGQNRGAPTVTLTENNLPAHVHSLPAGGNTAASGKGVPFDNLQPSLALNYIICQSCVVPSYDLNGEGGGQAYPLMGTVVPWAGSVNNIPTGWLLADGRSLNIGQNLALYTTIRTLYGGDGINQFRLPDLRGRTIIGAGERPGSTYGALVGEILGSDTRTILASQMPTHTHPLTPSGTTGPAGSGQPIDNRQPSIAMTYLIASGGNFPTQFQAETTAPYVGDIVAFAGDKVPDGYMLADGRTIQRSQFGALGALLGLTYGGDGTTFKLPDLRTRAIIGAGAGVPVGQVAGSRGTSNFTIDSEGNYVYDLGEVAGTSDIPLDVDNLGAHGEEDLVPEPNSLALIGMAFLCGATAHRKRTR